MLIRKHFLQIGHDYFCLEVASIRAEGPGDHLAPSPLILISHVVLGWEQVLTKDTLGHLILEVPGLLGH